MDGMDADYDTDILAWSERQAELLRQHAAASTANTEIDWPNVIEEIESVGNEQLHAVKSYLTQALIHMLKVQAWPTCSEVPHWLSETRRFRAEAADRYAASMRRKIDLAQLYRRALHIMPTLIDDQPPLPVPDVCPVTLDDLLSED